MRREDIVDLFDRLPIEEHSKVQAVLRTNMNVSIDTLMRLEEHYVVFRGREAGNQDEGRAFFVPYDEIACMKLERVVQTVELEKWYSDLPAMHRKGPPADGTLAETPLPAPMPLDPAEIARQNLLERIRAARSVVTKK
jgi:hypothetical protein